VYHVCVRALRASRPAQLLLDLGRRIATAQADVIERRTRLATLPRPFRRRSMRSLLPSGARNGESCAETATRPATSAALTTIHIYVIIAESDVQSI
jgi:hypothetical protein